MSFSNIFYILKLQKELLLCISPVLSVEDMLILYFLFLFSLSRLLITSDSVDLSIHLLNKIRVIFIVRAVTMFTFSLKNYIPSFLLPIFHIVKSRKALIVDFYTAY